MKNPKKILITGASSGLGAALAIVYAKPGNVLFLSGRDKERLGDISKKCESLGAIAKIKVIDITKENLMKKYLAEIIDNNEMDLVIANAGISGGTLGGAEGEERVKKIFATNVGGLLNTILPFITHFEKVNKGQIAIISSLSGFRGMPSCPAYSASKGAVKLFGEAIRGLLSSKNIEVSVVTPGYIKTPMTDANKFPMPFMISADKAALIIKKGLENNKARISFPFPLYFIVWLLSCLPPSVTDAIFSRLPKK